jgi:hypothetical protein
MNQSPDCGVTDSKDVGMSSGRFKTLDAGFAGRSVFISPNMMMFHDVRDQTL